MSNNKIEISIKDIPIVVEELEKANAEIERLNNNWQQAIEDLSSIANELELEEGNTIYDILDKIRELKGEDKE